jgi:hypothetical protein
MELTQACFEEIAMAARDVDSGSLKITIQTRPEDRQAFDMRLEYEKRYRIGRAIPTVSEAKSGPRDKY